jgi:predicted dehydrogenase
LAALCDLHRELAEIKAAEFGFTRVYTELTEMLEKERPDGCIAITPFVVTLQTAIQNIHAGVPLLIEKPLGANLEEAEEICALVERTGASAMVSMNRRFDPALIAALNWKRDRPIVYLRGTMIRHNRRQTDFFEETAIHAVDTIRTIAGEIRQHSVTVHTINGVQSFIVSLTFENGASGVLEVFPTSGSVAEYYELLGPDYRMLIQMGEKDAGTVKCWEQDRLVFEDEPARGMPRCVQNGAYAETEAFIAALQGKRSFHPTPTDVLPSSLFCHEIARETEKLS